MDLLTAEEERVDAPTLPIVGGNDPTVVALNEQAAVRFTAQVDIAVVPGATHLFEEPGALEAVIEFATMGWVDWSQQPAPALQHRLIPPAEFGHNKALASGSVVDSTYPPDMESVILPPSMGLDGAAISEA